MQFLEAFEQMESGTEFVVQRFRVIAHHIETAASSRALRSEGADDYMSPPA
jgi:hypothetical protein